MFPNNIILERRWGTSVLMKKYCKSLESHSELGNIEDVTTKKTFRERDQETAKDKIKPNRQLSDTFRQSTPGQPSYQDQKHVLEPVLSSFGTPHALEDSISGSFGGFMEVGGSQPVGNAPSTAPDAEDATDDICAYCCGPAGSFFNFFIQLRTVYLHEARRSSVDWMLFVM